MREDPAKFGYSSEDQIREELEILRIMRMATSATMSNFQEQRLLKDGVDRNSMDFKYLLVSQKQMWLGLDSSLL